MKHEFIRSWRSDDTKAGSEVARYSRHGLYVRALFILAMRFIGSLAVGSLAKGSLAIGSLVISSLAFASEELARSVNNKTDSTTGSPAGSLLTTDQILETFSNTLDRGAVQSGSNISAETRWYASGHFETRWWRAGDLDNRSEKVNLVTGRWTAKNNQRCVVFDHAPQDPWQCAAVFQGDDGKVVSLTPDGSVHGIHEIAPLALSAEDPH